MEIIERLKKAVEELNEVNKNLRELYAIKAKRESKRAIDENFKRLEMSEEEYEEYVNSNRTAGDAIELVIDKMLRSEITETLIKRDKLIIEIDELKDLIRSLN